MRTELRRLAERCGRSPTAFAMHSSALERGQRIGGFELIREIGRGGMGVVWEAREPQLCKRVALKLLHSESGSAECLSRFQREAEAASRLMHPCIVKFYSVGEADGWHFITQELVSNGTLAAHLQHFHRSGHIPDRYYQLVGEFFADVAEALQAAHEQGVIHRDVKPSNILVTQNGRPKIADFGLAVVLGDPSISCLGQLIGTPLYMSPEQAVPLGATVDLRTDIFSLGATMFEALTFRRPFEGRTLHEILNRIRLAIPPNPTSISPRCPARLAAICLRALQKEPSYRYPSAGAMAADLRA